MPTHSPCVAHTHTHNTAQTLKHTNTHFPLILLPKLKELRALMSTHEHGCTHWCAAKHSKVLIYISSDPFETASWDASKSYMCGGKIITNLSFTSPLKHHNAILSGAKIWLKEVQTKVHNEVIVFLCTSSFIDSIGTNVHSESNYAGHRRPIDLLIQGWVKWNKKLKTFWTIFS